MKITSRLIILDDALLDAVIAARIVPIADTYRLQWRTGTAALKNHGARW